MSVVSSNPQQPHLGNVAPVSQENVDGFLDRLNSYIQDFKVLDKNFSGHLDVEQVKNYFKSKGLPESGLLELTSRQKMDRLNVEQFAAAVEFSHLNKSNGSNGTSDFNEVLRHCEQATKQLQGDKKTKASHAGLLTNAVKELQNIIKLFFPLAFQKYTADEASRGIMPCTFDDDETETTDASASSGLQRGLSMKNTPTINSLQPASDAKEPNIAARDIASPAPQGKDVRPSMKDENTPLNNNSSNLKNNDSSYRSDVLNALHTAGQSQNADNNLDDQKKRDMETLPDESPNTVDSGPSLLPASAAALAAGAGVAALNQEPSKEAEAHGAMADNNTLADNASVNTVFTAHDGTDDNLKPSKSKRSVFSKIFGKSKDSKKDDIKDTTRSPSVRKSKSMSRSLSKRSRGVNSPETENGNVLDAMSPVDSAMDKHGSDKSIPVAPPRKTPDDINKEQNTRDISSSDSAPVPPPRKVPVKDDISASTASPDSKVYAPKLADPVSTTDNDADIANRSGKAQESDSSNVPAAISATMNDLKDDTEPIQTARGINNDEPSTATRDIDNTSSSTPGKTAAAAGAMGGIASMFMPKKSPTEEVDTAESAQNSRGLDDKTSTAGHSSDPLPNVSSKLAKLDASLENDPFMATDHQKKPSNTDDTALDNQADNQNADGENNNVARPGIVGMISAGILSMFSSSSKDNADETTRDIDDKPTVEDSENTRDVNNAANDTVNEDTGRMAGDEDNNGAKPNSKLAKIDASLRKSMLLSPGAHKSSTNNSSTNNVQSRNISNASPASDDAQTHRELNNKSKDTESDIASPAADSTEKATRPGLVGMLSSGIMGMFSSSNNVDESEKRNSKIEPGVSNGDNAAENAREISAEPVVGDSEADKRDVKNNSRDAVSNDHAPVSKLDKLDASVNNTMLPSSDADNVNVDDRQAKKPNLAGEMPAATIDSKNTASDDVATPSSTSSLGRLTAGLLGVFGSSDKGNNKDRSIDDNVNNTRDINAENLTPANDTNDAKAPGNDVTSMNEPHSEINDVPGFKNPIETAKEMPNAEKPKAQDSELEGPNVSGTHTDRSVDKPNVVGQNPDSVERSERPEMNNTSSSSSLGKLAAGIMGVFGASPSKTEQPETLAADGTGSRDIGDNANTKSADVNNSSPLSREANNVNTTIPNTTGGDCQLCSRFDKTCKTQDEFKAQAAQTPAVANQGESQGAAGTEATRDMPSDAQPADRSVNKPDLTGQLPKNALVDVDDSGDVDGATPGSTGSLGRIAAGIMGMFSSSSLNDESETPDISTDGKAFPMTDSNTGTRDMDTSAPTTNAAAGLESEPVNKLSDSPVDGNVLVDTQGVNNDKRPSFGSKFTSSMKDLKANLKDKMSPSDSTTTDRSADVAAVPVSSTAAETDADASRPNLSTKLTSSMKDLKANIKDKMSSSDDVESTPASVSTADESRPGLSARLSSGMKDLHANIKDRMSPSDAPSDAALIDASEDTTAETSRPSLSSKFRSSMKDLKANIKDKRGSSSEATTETPLVDVKTETEPIESRPSMSERLSSGVKDLKANLKKLNSTDSKTPAPMNDTSAVNDVEVKDASRPSLSAKISSSFTDLKANVKDKMQSSPTDKDTVDGNNTTMAAPIAVMSTPSDTVKDNEVNDANRAIDEPTVYGRMCGTENDLGSEENVNTPGSTSSLGKLAAGIMGVFGASTPKDETPASNDTSNATRDISSEPSVAIASQPVDDTTNPFTTGVDVENTITEPLVAEDANASGKPPMSKLGMTTSTTANTVNPSTADNDLIDGENSSRAVQEPVQGNQTSETQDKPERPNIDTAGSSSSLGKLAAGIMGVFGTSSPKTDQENDDITAAEGSRDIDNNGASNSRDIAGDNKPLKRDAANDAATAPTTGANGDCQLCAKFNKVCKTQADFEAQNAQVPNHTHAAEQQTDAMNTKPTMDEGSGEADRSVNVDGQAPEAQNNLANDDMKTSNSTSSLGKLAAGIMGVFGSSTPKDDSEPVTDDTSGTRDISNQPSAIASDENNLVDNNMDGKLDAMPEKRNIDAQPLLDVDSTTDITQPALTPQKAQENRSNPDDVNKSNSFNLSNAIALDGPASETTFSNERRGENIAAPADRNASDVHDKSNSLALNNAVNLDAPVSEATADDMSNRDLTDKERPDFNTSGSTSSIGKLAAGIMGVFGSSSPKEDEPNTTTSNDTRDINAVPAPVDTATDDTYAMGDAKKESKLTKLDNSFGDLPAASRSADTVPGDDSAAARELPAETRTGAPDAQFDDNTADVDASKKMSPVAAGSIGALAGGLMGKSGSKSPSKKGDEPDMASYNSLPGSNERDLNRDLSAEEPISTNASRHETGHPNANMSDKSKLAKLDARMNDMLPSHADGSTRNQADEQSKPYESFDDVDLDNNRDVSSTGDLVTDDADTDTKKPKKLGMLAAVKGMFSSSKDLKADATADDSADYANTRDINAKSTKLDGPKGTDSSARNDIRLSNSDFYDDSTNPFATAGRNDPSEPKLPPFVDSSAPQGSTKDNGLSSKLSKLDANVDNALLVAPGTDNERSKSGTTIDDSTPVIEDAAYNERPVHKEPSNRSNTDVINSERDLDNVALDNKPSNAVDDLKTSEGTSENTTSGSASSLGALAAGIKNIFGSSSPSDSEKPADNVEPSGMSNATSTRDIGSQAPKIDMEFGDGKLDTPVAPPRKLRDEASSIPADASNDSYGYTDDKMPTRTHGTKEPVATNNDEFDSMMNNVGAGMLTASAAATMAKHADPSAKDHLATDELPKRDESLNASMADSRFSELDNNDTATGRFGDNGSNGRSNPQEALEQGTSVHNSQQQPRELSINTERPPEVPAHRDASAGLKSPSFQDRSAADAIKVVYESMTSKLMSGPKSSSTGDDGEERVLKVRQGFGNFAGLGVKCVADDTLDNHTSSRKH